MADYVLRLEMDGPLATPLLSGTLFGHLCWAYRQKRGGDAGLAKWLEALRNHPFLISDGLPTGWVPKPLIRPRPHLQRQTVEQIDRKKEAKKARFVLMKDFLKIRHSVNEDHLAEISGIPMEWHEQRAPHNTINRLTGRTPESGGLFFVDEWWPSENSQSRDVYVSSRMEGSELEDLFGAVGEWGFGKDSSIGRGRFTVRVEPDESGLTAPAGNRRMSLSHGVLTDNMTCPRYRLHPVYAKIGGELSMRHSPFKYPLMLLQPGSTFTPDGAGPFGELLSQVHPELGFVRQNAWHLTAGFTEVG